MAIDNAIVEDLMIKLNSLSEVQKGLNRAQTVIVEGISEVEEIVSELYNSTAVTPKNITAKDAVRLSKYLTCDVVVFAREIANEYIKAPRYLNDPEWDRATLFATIWNAGRVQGIREERTKRRGI